MRENKSGGFVLDCGDGVVLSRRRIEMWLLLQIGAQDPGRSVLIYVPYLDIIVKGKERASVEAGPE